MGMLEQGSRQRRGNYVTSTLGRGIRRNSQVEVEGQIRIDGEDGSGEVRGQGGEGVRSGDGGLWAIAGTARRRRARLIRMVTPGGRHRGVVGTLFCSVDARSSTENSVVVTTLYAFNINLANSSPPAGLCNRDQCVLSTPDPGVKSADA